MIRTAFIAAAFVALAGTASAVTMSAEYTGTVVSSYDQTDTFGAGIGSSLDGMAYSLVFLYDTPAGYLNSGPNFVQQLGSEMLGFENPMISATITINGVSLSVSPTDSSNYRYDDGYTAYAQDNAGYYFNDMVTIVSQYVSDIFYSVTGFIPPDFSLPFAVAGGLGNGGIFSFQEFDNNTGVFFTNVSGSLIVETLTVTRVGDVLPPVPLPASLPLLLVALGGIAALRRRRTA